MLIVGSFLSLSVFCWPLAWLVFCRLLSLLVVVVSSFVALVFVAAVVWFFGVWIVAVVVGVVLTSPCSFWAVRCFVYGSWVGVGFFWFVDDFCCLCRIFLFVEQLSHKVDCRLVEV